MTTLKRCARSHITWSLAVKLAWGPSQGRIFREPSLAFANHHQGFCQQHVHWHVQYSALGCQAVLQPQLDMSLQVKKNLLTGCMIDRNLPNRGASAGMYLRREACTSSEALPGEPPGWGSLCSRWCCVADALALQGRLQLQVVPPLLLRVIHLQHTHLPIESRSKRVVGSVTILT